MIASERDTSYDLELVVTRYIDTCAETLGWMKTGRLSVLDGLTRIQEETMNTQQELTSDDLTFPPERQRMMEEAIARILAGDTSDRGLPTGMRLLDYRLGGGLQIGTNILAAQTGHGKSSLMLQIAERVAQYRGRVVFVAAEMTAKQLSMRSIARLSSVPLTTITRNTMTPQEQAKVERATRRLGDLQVVIKDRGAMTVAGIHNAVMRAQERMGGIDLIVTDYLQILGGDSEHEVTRITRISQALNGLALDMRCPVLAGSQFNREAAKSPNRPGIYDLKGGSSIEQDATVILLLHAAWDRTLYPDKAPDNAEMDIQIGKNRGGEAGGQVKVMFHRPEQRWTEFEIDPTHPAYKSTSVTADRASAFLDEDD